MTPVIQINPAHPEAQLIEQAGAIIRDGGLVAFPTETVYGLGADAMNEQAVARIFVAKGRPADNPLIVHVSHRRMLDQVAEGISEQAEALIERYWPGPLTLVLKRRPEVAASVSAGLPTVAVRMPNNAVALALIRAARTAIAAPSANRSGRPSPTTAAHVLADLDGRIEMILDGGATNIGIESTVLDVTSRVPMILRPGWVTEAQIAAITGAVARAASSEALQRSPGTRYRHYSPRARVVLVEHGSPAPLEAICKEHLKSATVGFIGHTPLAITNANFQAMILQADAAAYAGNIYAALREMDERGATVIIIEGISDAGAGAAVMDRLRRAASEIIGA
ncbi:MAG TPA: L-threonylcarbamoyladenylate synthase [Blastocatellia bacterium]|nr:L-threonylcarbamoyladenylate synthase [Blastocatellia bacterium]